MFLYTQTLGMSTVMSNRVRQYGGPHCNAMFREEFLEMVSSFGWLSAETGKHAPRLIRVLDDGMAMGDCPLWVMAVASHFYLRALSKRVGKKYPAGLKTRLQNTFFEVHGVDGDHEAVNFLRRAAELNRAFFLNRVGKSSVNTLRCAVFRWRVTKTSRSWSAPILVTTLPVLIRPWSTSTEIG